MPFTPARRVSAADENLYEHDTLLATGPEVHARLRQWSHDRFGCFIHWGPSVVLGGTWQGVPQPGLAEWIQYTAKIPTADYREVAARFNPTGFDADEWVANVAAGGARHLVFTAKHHDGFAMYHSKVSDFNIVDATPFGRDPLAELAVACRRHGLRLGIYYSHTIDWEDPDAVGPQCNDWDFDAGQARFERYWQRKALPQLRELLTGYGDLAVVWFDMPAGLPPECAAEATRLVRELQPGAAINSRIGSGGEADYLSMDDNYFNNLLPRQAWETAATTNDTWGWKTGPCQWKPVSDLCESLAYVVSRGGNYLLNVGPDLQGRWPQEAVDRFAGIGRWLETAGEGIYGAGAPPWDTSFPWGHATAAGGTVYLHVTDPDACEVLVPAPGRPGHGWRIPVPAGGNDLPRLARLDPNLPPAPLADVELETVHLAVWQAKDDAGTLSWSAHVPTAGRYRVDLISKETGGHQNVVWKGEGLSGEIDVDGDRRYFSLHRDGDEYYPVLTFWLLVRSRIATIELARGGTVEVTLRGLPVTDSKWSDGVNLLRLELVPEPSLTD